MFNFVVDAFTLFDYIRVILMMKKDETSLLTTLQGLIENKPDVTFGELLTATRREANLTQRAMSKRVGMKQPTIAAWERGSRVCGPTLGRDLARALGLPEEIQNAFGYAAARTLKTAPKFTSQWSLPLEVVDGVARALRRAGIPARYQVDRVILDVPGSVQSGRLASDRYQDGMTICGKDGSLIRVEVLVNIVRPTRTACAPVRNIGVSKIKQVIGAKPVEMARVSKRDVCG